VDAECCKDLRLTTNDESYNIKPAMHIANSHWNMGVIWHDYWDAKHFGNSKSTKHLKHCTKNIESTILN